MAPRARLTCKPTPLDFGVMLQHNAKKAGKRAHVAHAAVMGVHALCCGMPGLAMLAAAVSGTASGAALASESFAEFHAILHHHEGWILAISAALVVSGAILEMFARRGPHRHGFPWLFAFSTACFGANVAIILGHRAFG